jgi:hypothetical protein
MHGFAIHAGSISRSEAIVSNASLKKEKTARKKPRWARGWFVAKEIGGPGASVLITQST